jgi:hypothetical protein
VPALRTEEDLFAELATLTGMSAGEWSDFVSCSPDQQAFLVQGYRDQSWTKSVDTLAKVMAVLAVIGAIAGVVSGVSGAATAVKALRVL